MWFIGVEVEQETSAPPPEKNPGSAPEIRVQLRASCYWDVSARHQRDGARRQIKIDGR